MQIKIDLQSKIAKYKQIAKQIEILIISGDLPNGYILPPERKLAEQLHVNRTTVLNAYRQLKDQGLIDSKVGQGTMVTNESSKEDTLTKHILPMHYGHLYSEKGQHEISEFEKNMLRGVAHEDMIQFGVGIIDSPLESYFNQAMDTLTKRGVDILSHTPYSGLDCLKTAIAQHLLSFDIEVNNKNMMITSGSQQGIDLIGDVFINKGDVVVVEEPTYFFATQSFRSKGAKVIGIPMKEDGMDLSYLEQVLKSTRVKFIYTMPNYQNPTNHNMSSKKKSQLLQLAYSYQTLILEDGAYNDLGFEGHKPMTLKSMDYNNQVVYISTFSKLLSMGPRIGFMIAHEEILSKATYLKHLSDIHSASLSQWLLYELLDEGHVLEIKNQLAAEHEHKYRHFSKCFESLGFEELGMTYEKPSGGIYVWITCGDYIDTMTLLTIARKEGVTFVPGGLFSVNNGLSNTIRLNYVYESETRIEAGLIRLKQAVLQLMKQSKGGKAKYDPLAIL